MEGSVKTQVENRASELRRRVKELAKECKAMKEYAVASRGTREDANPMHDPPEVIANLMLVYRHLEDASMRLGKAIQASDGGVSVYDRETTVGA